LSDETDVPDYKELQGRIALNKGNYKESEDIFNALLDEDPFSSPYWNRLASSQFMRNHINDSITSSEFSIAINPNDEEAILNKANGLFSLENYEEALIYYRRFTHLCPEEETGYLFQGITLLNLNRTQEALQKLKEAEEKASKQSSNLLEIYQQLSFTLSHLGHLDEALSYIDKAEKLNDAEKGEMNVLRGHLLLEHERQKEAQIYFQKALSESKDSPSIILHIAISVYDCGYLKFSYKLFKELYYTEKGNDMLEGYSYFAMCCRDMKHYEEYLQVLKKACELNPSEAKNVLGEYFPREVEPSQYYQYALTHPQK
jgi:tetratricopeptide (TPR) repeat protein